MHVGIALLTLFPGRVGGSEANVRGLLGQFAEGHGPSRVTVLGNALVADAYADVDRGPVEVRRASGYRQGDRDATRMAGMLAGWLNSRRLAGELAGVDLVHYPVTVPIPAVRDVPTVVTVYDLQHHDLPQLFSRAERSYRRWAYDGAASRVSLVLTTSEYSKTRLAALRGVDPGRVESIPMGIDHDRFQPEPTPADDIVRAKVGERYILFPANLWPHKNHDRLVAALGQVSDRGLHLVLTGQTYAAGDRLEAAARAAGVADRVHHLGHVAAEELPALMRNAEAMVFPSLYEGFGSPPLEAMACGCPVASSDRASLAEMVGNAALVIDPESVPSIARGIERVTSDQALRETLRRDGLRHAAQFTWQACAERHIAAYRRVTASNRPDER